MRIRINSLLMIIEVRLQVFLGRWCKWVGWGGEGVGRGAEIRLASKIDIF